MLDFNRNVKKGEKYLQYYPYNFHQYILLNCNILSRNNPFSNMICWEERIIPANETIQIELCPPDSAPFLLPEGKLLKTSRATPKVVTHTHPDTQTHKHLLRNKIPLWSQVNSIKIMNLELKKKEIKLSSHSIMFKSILKNDCFPKAIIYKDTTWLKWRTSSKQLCKAMVTFITRPGFPKLYPEI